jgi:hypothetical protein
MVYGNFHIEVYSTNKPCTRQRLKRMLSWFRSKGEAVTIHYVYNDSMGRRDEREYSGVISAFTIETERYGTAEADYCIKITLASGETIEEHLSDGWEFTGLGKLEFCNSGPYCYFTIKFKEKTGEKTI